MKHLLHIFLLVVSVQAFGQSTTYEYKRIRVEKKYYYCAVSSIDTVWFTKSMLDLKHKDSFSVINGRKFFLKPGAEKRAWNYFESDSIVAKTTDGIFNFTDALEKSYQLTDTALNKVDFKAKYILDGEKVITLKCFVKNKKYFLEVDEPVATVSDADFVKMMALFYGAFIIDLRGGVPPAVSAAGTIARILLLGH